MTPLRSVKIFFVEGPLAERQFSDYSSGASFFPYGDATYANRVVRDHAVALLALAVEVPDQLLAALGGSEKEVGAPRPPRGGCRNNMGTTSVNAAASMFQAEHVKSTWPALEG